MMIERLTISENYGYSFLQECVQILVGERLRISRAKACSGNNHHILFVASKDWGRACYARRTHNHHHEQRHQSYIPTMSKNTQRKKKKPLRDCWVHQFLSCFCVPCVTTWSHLVIHFVGLVGPKSTFRLMR